MCSTHPTPPHPTPPKHHHHVTQSSHICYPITPPKQVRSRMLCSAAQLNSSIEGVPRGPHSSHNPVDPAPHSFRPVGCFNWRQQDSLACMQRGMSVSLCDVTSGAMKAMQPPRTMHQTCIHNLAATCTTPGLNKALQLRKTQPRSKLASASGGQSNPCMRNALPGRHCMHSA
jgi:hypothetical protein